MNGPLRALLAGVALVVLIAGAAFVASPGDDVGGQGRETPAPVTSPRRSATPAIASGTPGTARLSEAAVGPDGLAPGTYVIDEPFPITVGLTVPAGWDVWTVTADSAGLLAHTEDIHGSGWPLAFWIIDKVGDPCGSGQMSEVGPTVDHLVQALQDLTGYEVSAPAPVTIDGHTGVQLAISAPEGLGACGRRPLWSTASDPAACSIAEGERFEVRILDVDGTRLVIGSADYAQTSAFEERWMSPDPSAHADDIPEIRAIVDSITLDP